MTPREREVRPGDRVFVVHRTDDRRVYLLGFGTCAGPVETDARLYGRRVTCAVRLDLDDGRQLWSYQVWYGPESDFAGFCAGRDVVTLAAGVAS